MKLDGDPISEPIVLKFGMNLIMGGDHLRCVTEELARDDLAARTTSDAFEEAGLRIGRLEIAWSWWLIGGIALVGAALIGFEWLFSRVGLCSLRLQPISGKRRWGRSPPQSRGAAYSQILQFTKGVVAIRWVYSSLSVRFRALG